MNGCAGEYYVRYKASFLIPLFGSEKECFATILHDGRIVKV